MLRLDLRQLPRWVIHAAVALAYGLAFVLLQKITIAHWIMLTVLRLGCALLLPYRYWPALLVGEEIPLALTNYLCLHPFGLPWVLFSTLVPPLGLVMLVTWPMRHWLPDREGHVAERMGAFILCTLAVAILNAGRNVILYTLIDPATPGYKPGGLAGWAGQYFLGSFLPVLAFLPVILAVHEALPVRYLLGRLRLRPALASGIFGLLGLVMAMTIAGFRVTGESHRAIQVALFVPVALAALWFGWRSASLVGAAASVGLMLLMPARRDIGTLEAETLMAFTLSTVLMLGARTSAMRQALRTTEASLAQARHELYLNELKMRHGALGIEQELAFLHHTHSRLLHRLRHFLHGSDETDYRNQISEARQRFYRLAESFAPREWLRLGDPILLWTSGPLVEALEEVGIAYNVESGGELARLAPDVNMALYRLGCEAVTYVLNHMPTDRIQVTTQTRSLWNRQIEVQLVVDSDGHPIPAPTRERLLVALGATGLSISDMQGRAALFDGRVKVEEPTVTSLRITVWLRDSPVPVRQEQGLSDGGHAPS